MFKISPFGVVLVVCGWGGGGGVAVPEGIGGGGGEVRDTV